MTQLHTKNLTDREIYKLLIGSILPRPVALITTLNENKTTNAAPFSYVNIVSSNPAIISLSVKRKNHEPKDTARNILRERSFVLHVVDEFYLEEANKTSKPLPYGKSEITNNKLTLIDSSLISAKSIKEAKIRMEIKLYTYLPIEKDNQIETDFFLGEVVMFHIEEGLLKDGKINQDLLKPIGRLAGNDYTTLDTTITIEREN
jgi:flavin reductase (DIM6/NTAB) family NADH-FMN oxidoreductase RutF